MSSFSQNIPHTKKHHLNWWCFFVRKKHYERTKNN
nr:MAG TPA: hypothetical protein [Caudoviricetes sp.]